MRTLLLSLLFALTCASPLRGASSQSTDFCPAGCMAPSADVDGDGTADISDLSALVDRIIQSDSYPAMADINIDGTVDVADITSLVIHLLGDADFDESPRYEITGIKKFTKAQLIDRTLAPYSSQMSSLMLTVFKIFLGYNKPDDYTYREASVRYLSTDHTGKPIYLSGIVSYRTGGSAADSPISQIVVDSHPTITDDASCPSKGGTVAQLLLPDNPAAIVAADYQGYGESRNAIHPYLNETLTARQQLDLLKVAIDYLSGDDSGATFAPEVSSYIMGYSQGGAVALATHRLMECRYPLLADAIGLKGSICGDGPYSLNLTLDYYKSRGEVSIPVILPMIVRGMMDSYPQIFGSLQLTDYFQSGFLSAGGGLMDLVDAKEIKVTDYNTLLGASNPLSAKFDIDDIFIAGALAADSPQMTAITRAFNLNNCILGWTPKRRVAFYHSPDDTVVPYVNLDDASEWPSSTYTITVPDASGLDHTAVAIYYYMEVIKKGPAGML